MASKKLNISQGLSAVAMGTTMATGGIAGVEFEVRNPSQPAQFMWDDSEEQHYRMWLREQQENRASKTDPDWSELDSEEAYRAKMKEHTDSCESESVHWEDGREREFRRKYADMRSKQLSETDWNELRAEEQHREKIRRRQELAAKKNPVRWDDAEERKCQERYRQKYSSQANN